MFRYGLKYATRYTSQEEAFLEVKKRFSPSDDEVYTIEEYSNDNEFISAEDIETVWGLFG